jgi:hypothetical protein
MGQKVNPIIFRLSYTNHWACKYVEKKSVESALCDYKNIEVQKFIIRFFNFYGLIVQDLKISYLNSSLNIFVSYFPTLKISYLISDDLKNQKFRLDSKKISATNRINNKTIKDTKYNKYQELEYTCLSHKDKNIQTLQKEKQTLKLRRIKFLRYYKNCVLTQKYKSIYKIKNNFFLHKFFESLSAFIDHKFNINLTTKQLNHSIKQKFNQKNVKVLKKDLIKLRKYDRNEFFKEGINLLFLCSTHRNSAKLLSYFIAFQLKKFKRHNFFLRFIKSVLVLFNNKIFSKLKGIKIKVKGRFNKAPRARSKIIKIGHDVPVLTLKSKINYAETTSFTANGTFGVKVWIFEK